MIQAIILFVSACFVAAAVVGLVAGGIMWAL
jgi:hypothetical protein